jgi:zinc transport system substrate-binding protein
VSANHVIKPINMKKLLSILSLSIFIITGCQTAQPEVKQVEDSYTVITSFYPLHFFTSELVKEVENVEVMNLIPSGGEPHSYEPSTSQLAQMESANLLIAQGGLEPWLEGLEHELEKKGVKILEVNSHLELMAFEEDHEDHEEHEDEGHSDEDEGEEHDEEHDEDDHGDFDPHTWLDPVLSVEIVEHISEELIKMDPSHEAIYSANTEDLINRLSALNDSFEMNLASCSLDTFITSHDAFGYLAERYDLHAHSVSGVSPFDEPSAKQITELIELSEEEGLKHIFFEVLANSEAAEVLAEEAGLTSLILNPISGLSSDQVNEDYFSLMEENLENLTIGLACE